MHLCDRGGNFTSINTILLFDFELFLQCGIFLFFIYFYFCLFFILFVNKGNNKITELRTILQRESQNS